MRKIYTALAVKDRVKGVAPVADYNAANCPVIVLHTWIGLYQVHSNYIGREGCKVSCLASLV